LRIFLATERAFLLRRGWHADTEGLHANLAYPSTDIIHPNVNRKATLKSDPKNG